MSTPAVQAKKTPHQAHTHPTEAKKAEKTKCDNCSQSECQCQTDCCGGACPNCTF